MNAQTGTTPLVSYAAGSITGKRRDWNEDAFAVFTATEVFAVADGCGGQASGDFAAELAINAFAQIGASEAEAQSEHAANANDNVIVDPLVQAVLRANSDIFRGKVLGSGQGATVAAMRVSRQFVNIVHCGDCRVGLFRASNPAQERFKWITEDHTFQRQLHKYGKPIPASKLSFDRILTRMVGHQENIAVDSTCMPTIENDMFVLCTGGISRQIATPKIATILANPSQNLSEICRSLLDESDIIGGENATVILLQISRRQH